MICGRHDGGHSGERENMSGRVLLRVLSAVLTLAFLLMLTSKFRVKIISSNVPRDTAPGPTLCDFRLDQGLGNGASSASGAQEAPAITEPDDPATSTKKGSFDYDRIYGYPHEWPDMDAFQKWCHSEQRAHTIEIKIAKVEHAKTLGRSLWTTKHVYRCARYRIGQKSDQQKLPKRKRKILRKGTGCRYQIVIKCYPHTPVVLGRYITDHNHDLGSGNMLYTRLSDGVREQIKSLLTCRVDTREIVRYHINLTVLIS